MKTIIIPGYGDRFDYIERATKNWARNYDLEPEVYVFGWSGDPETYDANWREFDEVLQHIGVAAIIGISAGASVAARALQIYPEKIKKVVTICGPLHPEKMNPSTLHNKYPILERSLENISLENIDPDRVMTLRPLHDDVVSTEAMFLEGAHDKRIKTFGHAFTIGWTMFTKGETMANFIQGI